MTLGKGAVYTTSNGQNIMTQSSTEAELVGVHDVLPQIIWTNKFLLEQGYGSSAAILHQDNTSAILLEENGKESSTKRTRHIDIRYFYIKDKVKSGEVKIRHCPTLEMIADFFMKFRNFILNCDPPQKRTGITGLCWE
mmetsp:Transcript_35431/g.50239  ORF Transcript_35431/g.50239 Transcript_35431/m.50239 type:complete len:138 (-) Transcript_35431:188-601(-)